MASAEEYAKANGITDPRLVQFMKCASGECTTCCGPAADKFMALLVKKPKADDAPETFGWNFDE